MIEELTDRYGEPPAQVANLVAVSRLRRQAQKSGLGEVVTMGSNLRLAPADLPDSIQVRMRRMYPDAKYFAQAGAVSIPLPVVDGAVLEDAALIDWTRGVLTALFPAPAVAPAE